MRYSADFIVMLFIRQVSSVFALKCIIDSFGVSHNIKGKIQLWPSVTWDCVNSVGEVSH